MTKDDRATRRRQFSVRFVDHKTPAGASQKATRGGSHRSVPLRFFPALPPGTTRKEYGLQESARRAHAARVTHIRKRAAAHADTHAVSRDSEWRISTSQPTSKPRDPNLHQLHHILRTVTESDAMRMTSLSKAWRSDPISYLLCGNSDPFDCLGFKLTPQLNRAIIFARDCYIPSIYVPQRTRSPQCHQIADSLSLRRARFTGTRRAQTHFRIGFESRGPALASILAFLHLLIRTLPEEGGLEVRREMLEIQESSLLQLRTDLGEHAGSSRLDYSVALHIVLLFVAACAEFNPAAAKIHASQLPFALKSFDQKLRVHILTILMSQDVDMACQVLKRPILDYEKFIASRLRSFWSRGPELLTNVPVSARNVHHAVTGPKTRDALIRLRSCLCVSGHYSDYDPKPNEMDREFADSLRSWMGSISLYDIGTLLNHSIDLLETEDDLTDSRQAALRLIEAATAITALYTVRTYMHEFPASGYEVRSTSHLIIPMLEKTLREAYSLLPGVSRIPGHDEVIFWIVFTGAHYEIRNRAKSGGELSFSPTLGWFSRQLVEQARYLELLSWTGAESLLQQFVLSANVEHHPLLWYEDLVGGSYDLQVNSILRNS